MKIPTISVASRIKRIIIVLFPLSLFSCLSTTTISQNNSPVESTNTMAIAQSTGTILSETLMVSETKSPKPTKTKTIENTLTKTMWFTGDAANISSYYGTWTTTRHEFFAGGTRITKEEADGFLGKGMQFDATTIEFDDGFLWLSESNCSNTSYTSIPESDMLMGGYYHFMLPDYSPDARTDRIFFEIFCGGKKLTGFEISKYYEIVFFYDNYYFFLEKL
jgi:hypothetical protein